MRENRLGGLFCSMFVPLVTCICSAYAWENPTFPTSTVNYVWECECFRTHRRVHEKGNVQTGKMSVMRRRPGENVLLWRPTIHDTTEKMCFFFSFGCKNLPLPLFIPQWAVSLASTVHAALSPFQSQYFVWMAADCFEGGEHINRDLQPLDPFLLPITHAPSFFTHILYVAI